VLKHHWKQFNDKGIFMSEAAENVDALVQEAYAPEAPMEANGEGGLEDAQPQLDAVEEPSSSGGESGFKQVLKHKGKEVVIDDEQKYSMLAHKGYDYEQKMHQFKVDRKLYEKERSEREAQYKELEQINNYAKENPAFEQLIQREWAKIQAGGQIEVAPEDRVQVLESRLNQVLDKLENQGKDLETRRVAEMEAKQEMAIESYKEKHSDFDWDKKDESGATLEDRIMQQMIDKEVKDFQIMADFVLKNEQIARKTLEAKESVAKDIQKANKLGLGKVTKKSQLGVKKSEDIGNKSYDDLVGESLRELGYEF
jgi:hypothetical protein